MNDLNELLEYDDEAAVEFIYNYLPQELKEKLTEKDIIYYILDLICEFYEQNDYLNEDDEEKEEKELIAFIVQQSASDKIGVFLPEEIRLILRAETAYSDTLNISE